MASAKRLMELRHDCRSNKKDGGDERAGVADSDPPHEVDDGEAPADGDGHAPDADAFQEQVADGVEHHHRHQKGDAEADEPSVRRGTGEHDRADLLRDRAEGVAGLDHRSLILRPLCLAVTLFRGYCSAP
jgi:hypothetical protein